MCLKKQLLDDPETSAQGLGRGFGQPVYPPGDKTVLGCTQVGVCFQSPEGQNGNLGFYVSADYNEKWAVARGRHGGGA